MTDAPTITWGRDPHALLTLDEAWNSIARAVTPLDAVETALAQAADRVLAAPVIAADDYPPFHKAMMDGFAVRSADCASGHAELAVVGLAAAGGPATPRLKPGQAVRINTGAPVPPGADAVVMIEKTRVSKNEKTVCVEASVSAGRHIEPRAGIRRKGDSILTPPLRLGPAEVAAAATAGVATVSLFRAPGVGIVLTGDELVPAGAPTRPGQIHESNGPMLSALMRRFGAVPREPVIAGDTMEALTARFREALAEPVVLAVGGMSMGTLDLVPEAFESVGVRWQWHGVAIRPGKPVAYGRGPDGQHVFGLPGNPASAFVCAWLFVRMVIDGLQGLPARPPERWPAILETEIKAARDARPAFIPARVSWTADRHLSVRPRPWRGSSDPFGLSGANALLVRDDPTKGLPAGSAVDVIVTGPVERS